MSVTYVLDTNAISYILRGEGGVATHFQNEVINGSNLYAIPFVVYYEIQRWLKYKPTAQIKLFANAFNALFTSVSSKAEMSTDVWNKASDIFIELKQKGLLIGDADILVAAYCLVNSYTLVTRNHKDFTRISGLTFVDWF